MVREGRELIPTAKASQLMTLLRGLDVNELTAPELTGEWEHKLALMEKGAMSRDDFMREIAQMTQIIVKRAKEYDSDTIPGDYTTLTTPCPNCNGKVRENYRRFACVGEKTPTDTGCGFSISKIPGGRQFEIPEVEQFLKNREIGPLQGFRSKMGRPFAAILKIVADDETKNLKLEFDFGQTNDDANSEPVDFAGQQSLGTCPKSGGNVYELGLSYVCEHAVNPPKTCDFKTGKIILQQEVGPDQIKKLLATGKTDLLPGFKSSRTNRFFKAFLIWDAEKGKVGFEFEPRKPAAKKVAKGAKEASIPARETSVSAPVASAKRVTAKKAAAKKATVKKAASKVTTA
jgi:DNA topoisomerase-3